jgi:hypothetical protein
MSPASVDAAYAAPASSYAPPRSAYTVPQFCAEHGIGRNRYFTLQNEGLGPRTYKVGKRIYISAEAAAEWRAMMEQRSVEQRSIEPPDSKPRPAKPFALKRGNPQTSAHDSQAGSPS